MKNKWFLFSCTIAFLLLGFCGCKSNAPVTSGAGKEKPAPTTTPEEGPPGAPAAEQPLVPKDADVIQITTSGIDGSGLIQSEYTCDGKDISPELSWRLVPAAAESLALIMDDPDAPAGTWVHWVMYNIPATARGLRSGVPLDESVPNTGVQGVNSRKSIGYHGPCPPGGTHRYFFKLYALDARLGLEPGADKAALEAAMKGHVVGFGQLVGKYSREK